MQYQMSSASVPNVAPPPSGPTVAPRLVTPSPKRPFRRGLWLLLVLGLVAGAVWWARQLPSVRQAAGQSKPAVVRTATVGRGMLNKTIRLSGTTGAEKFVSLVTPQLRGSRSRRNSDGSTPQLASVAAPLVVQSNARTGVGRSATTSPSASTSSDGSVSSTAGSTRSSGSQAFQSATSRVSRGTSSSANSGSGSGGATSSTSSSGSANGGLGSTANNLQGTGFAGAGGGGGGGGGGGRGGGGGGGDFSLVLQNAAKPGSMVRKGQVIAEFDRQYMLNRLDDYRASVSQQEDAVKKLRAELGIARKAYEQKLEGAKADLDKARLDVKTAPVLSAMEAERVKLAAEEAEARYKQVSTLR